MINYTAPDTTQETDEVLESPEVNAIKQKSLVGVVSFFIRGAFLQIVGFVAGILLSAFLDPADFGIYGFVTQIIGLLVFFSDVGLAATLVQQKTEPTLKQYRVAFTIQQLLSWLIVALSLGVVATGLVSSKTGSAGVWVLLSLAISFPLVSLKTISSIKLERKLEFSKVVVPQILEQLTFFGVLVVMAWRGAGVIAYAYATMARSLVGVVAMWFLQPWSIGLSWDRAVTKQLVGFGIRFQLYDLLARVKDNLFYLVMGWFLPLTEFGYINWAKNWSMYPYNLTVGNVSAVMFPTYSRLQGHPHVLKRAIEKTTFFISLLIVPLIIGTIILMGPLTEIVPRYAKWQPALLSFTLFALSIIPAAISSPLVSTLNAIGQIKQSLKLMGMWLSLTWLLTPLLVYWYGFNGVAWASLIISLTSILPVYLVKKEVDVAIWAQVWRPLVAGVVMSVVGWLGQDWWARSYSWLLFGGVVSGLSYGVTFVVIGWSQLRAEVGQLVARYWQKQ